MSRLRPGRRTAAVLAILLLVAVAGSDFVIAGFWASHPTLTTIVSALTVVLFSVAMIEVVLSRRSERRWRILAQSALIELAEAANTTWTSLATALGLQGATERSPDFVREALAAEALESTWRIVAAALDNWTEPMLVEKVELREGDVIYHQSRASILVRLMTHDTFHTGEVSAVLGSHGLTGVDPWDRPSPEPDPLA
jgi:hypothetical protein